jgi:hypothetical protein
VDLNPSWEATSCAATWQLPNILCELEVQYAVFTGAFYLPLSWARSIQSIPPHPSSQRFILILSTNMHISLPNCHVSSTFSTSILYAFLFTPSFYMPFLSHCTWQKKTVMKLLIMQFSQISCHITSPQPKYSLQCPFRKHSVLNFVFRQQVGRHKLLNWIVTSINSIHFPLNFILNQILICYDHPPIFIFSIFHVLLLIIRAS